jgi:tetratricopeptide (TPR) repeat protein
MYPSPNPSQTPQPDFTVSEALARAQAHWNAGQAGQAENLCRRVLAFWPGQGDAVHLLGLIAHAYGRLDLALAHVRAAVRAPCAPALYAANLAEMCRQQGLLEEGEAAGRRAVAQDPQLAAGWNNLGILLQEAGKYAESRNCLERVLVLQPGNAQACNNLGNTLKRLGEAASAERMWRRALALKPEYAQPHSNLCNMLGEQGAYEAALAHGRRAIEIDPCLTDSYINLAALETARNHLEAALRWLDALLGFAPKHALALASRALVLKKLECLPEALQSAERAVAAAPRNAEAQNALGQVLQEMGETAAALDAYELAAALPGTAAEQALINRAVLFMEQGETEAAKTAFDRAEAAFPRATGIWFNRADLQKFVPGDPAIAAMETRLAAAEGCAPNDAMLLHFALGKAYLDCGDSAPAFRHLNAGNALKRAQFTYDPATASGLMAMIARVFSPFLLSRFENAGPGAELPVFIICMPRSGTTLVEQILASHPQVHGAGELALLQKLVSTLGDFPAGMMQMASTSVHRLGAEYLARVAPLARGKCHVIDKMPANFAYAGLIRLMLPGARILHCRRDPVDTCLSCYSKLFSGEQRLAYEQTELGLFYRDYAQLMAHWRDVLPASHFLEVQYEDVIADVGIQARRMLDFLALDWHPACLEFYRTPRAVRTARVNQVRQPVYQTARGRWRPHATELQPLLTALGIAPP